MARYAASALELGSGVLALLSIFAYWFLITGAGLNLAYFPGDSYRLNGTFSTYASGGFGQVGGVLLAILVLAIVGGVILIVAGFLTFIFTYRRRKHQFMRLFGLVLAGLVFEALAIVIAPFLIPWSLNNSSASATFCGDWTVSSPCHSFFGSGYFTGSINGASYTGINPTFVGADGWFIMIGALAVGIIGLAIWLLGRNPGPMASGGG